MRVVSASQSRFPGVLALFLLADGLAAAPGWRPAAKVSGGDGFESTSARIACGAGGRLHLVWEESGRDGESVSTRIGYREHDGELWLPPRHLSTPGQAALSPSVAADPAGQPHVVWLERGGSASKFRVWYTYRQEGEDWIRPERVSATERVGFEGRPQAAVLASGEVVAVWADDQSEGNPEVFWNRRSPEGWRGGQPLSAVDEYHSGDVHLGSLDGGRLTALFVDRRREGFLPRLRIYGEGAWGAMVTIGRPQIHLGSPRLVAAESSLHFFSAVREGVAVRSTDESLLWDEPVLLPSNDAFPAYDVARIGAGRLLVAYRDRLGGLEYLLSREFDAEGRDFVGPFLPVAEVTSPAMTPSLAVSAAGEPHLVWTDPMVEDGSEMVFYSAYRADAGPSFRRGDLEGLGLDLSDTIAILGALFLGERQPECADAADADDDGGIDITDPIFILRYLFTGGSPPPEPFPRCGLDLTSDPLACDSGVCF